MGDEYYGFDPRTINQTRRPGFIGPVASPDTYSDRLAREQAKQLKPGEQAPKPQPRATDPGQLSGMDIKAIQKIVMGEQPGNADLRAGLWTNVAENLQHTATQLRQQADKLNVEWESPAAKEAAFMKLGKDLAYLDAWHKAATENSSALKGLASVMRQYQKEMAQLYQEFEDKHGEASPSIGDHLSGMFLGTGTLEQKRAQAKQEVQDEYSVKARDLVRRMENEYSPYLGRLASAQSAILTPPNAVYNQQALGMPAPPLPPTMGGGPPAPGTAPGAPPAPKNAPTPPPPPVAPRNAPTPPPVVPTVPPPVAPPPVAPKAPPVPTGVAPPPLPDGLRTAGAPPAPGRLNAPTPGGLNAPTPGVINNPGAPPAINGRSLGVLGNNPSLNAGAAPTPAAFKGGAGAPPGLGGSTLGQNALGGQMTPPPAPQANQTKAPQQKQRKDTPGLGGGMQAPQQMTPPPSQGATERNRPGAPKQATQRNPDVADAFQAPPTNTSPSVLGDRKPSAPARRATPGKPDAQPLSGDSVPPVLANPHRGTAPKTHAEQMRARERGLRERKERRRELERQNSEFGAPPPPIAEAVFEGRMAAKDPVDARREKEASVPQSLLGTQPAVLDRRAAPPRSADQVAREIRKQVAESTEEAWAPQTAPGGPVVDKRTEQEYRAEPKPDVRAK
ncbi:hypothetical protein [Allokutzneria albata]|uniref:PPE family protein n=1 Tax=Allokutzneria albata TaxID=211114 RepID=A0A1G9W7N5_ALLAB|nr:hypothetical protein [Allokutzneria albata]SDM80564.1 hypothetical protein SAMN04489726_3447 [Allokutzneria albata]